MTRGWTNLSPHALSSGALMEDYNTTFSRLFGDGCRSKASPHISPRPGGSQNVLLGMIDSQRDRSPHRDDFGIGFMRAKSACSPSRRSFSEVLNGDDAAGPALPSSRASPTTARTSTIISRDLLPRPTSPTSIRGSLARSSSNLNFYEGGISDHESRRDEARKSALSPQLGSPCGPRSGPQRCDLGQPPPQANSQVRSLAELSGFAFDAPSVLSQRAQDRSPKTPRQCRRKQISPPRNSVSSLEHGLSPTLAIHSSRSSLAHLGGFSFEPPSVASPRGAGSTRADESPRPTGRKQFSPRRYSFSRLEHGLDEQRATPSWHEEFDGLAGKLATSPKGSALVGSSTSPESLLMRNERAKTKARSLSGLEVSEGQFRVRESVKARSRDLGSNRWK